MSSWKRYLFEMLKIFVKNSDKIQQTLSDGLLKNLDDSLMKSNFDFRLSKLSSKTLHIEVKDSNITPAELDRSESVLLNIHQNEYFSTEKAILRKKCNT